MGLHLTPKEKCHLEHGWEGDTIGQRVMNRQFPIAISSGPMPFQEGHQCTVGRGVCERHSHRDCAGSMPFQEGHCLVHRFVTLLTGGGARISVSKIKASVSGLMKQHHPSLVTSWWSV